MVYRKIELTPVDGRKSFYGKAYAVTMGNTTTLFSYDTKIATYNHASGTLEKTNYWNYSRTTARHQKAFLSYLGI